MDYNFGRYIKLFYIEKMIQSRNRGRYLIVEQKGYAVSPIYVESFGYRCSIKSLNQPTMEYYSDGIVAFYTRGTATFRDFRVIDVPVYFRSFISTQHLVSAYNGKCVKKTEFIDRTYDYLNTYTIE